MQGDEDERRDLERALYARPSGDAESRSRRGEALRLLRLDHEEAARAAQPPGDATPPTATAAIPRDVAAPPRRRTALIASGALVAGLALGAIAVSVLPEVTATPAATPSATATADPVDRFAALVEGWDVTTDLPIGMDLIARDADVYTPQFTTTQDERLLLTAPGGTSLCLALQRPDGSLSAGCTGLAAFFDARSIDVIGTDRGDGTPVYTRVSLRSDGSVEGGFQLVTEAAPEP